MCKGSSFGAKYGVSLEGGVVVVDQDRAGNRGREV
jgi:hypothetical protein